MRKKTERLLKFLGLICENSQEERELRHALMQLEAIGEDLDLTELEEFLKYKEKEMEMISYPSDNPFDPPSLEALGEEGIALGYEQFTERPLLWDDLERSALIMGSIGTGKTTLALNILKQTSQRGITSFVFDRRGDYFGLVNEGALFVKANSMGFNVLEAPPNVPSDVWLGKVAEVFCHTYDLLTGSKSLFEEVLLTVWRDKRGKANLWDVTARLERKDFLPVRTRQDIEYKGRIYDRLRLLRRKAIGIFNVTTIDLVALSQSGRMIIFDMDMEEQLRDFLTLLIIWYIWYYRKYNKVKEPRIIFLMDEARFILRKRSSEHFIAEIDLLFTGSRPFGMGFVVLEQVPSQLSKAVTANTNLKVAFNSQGVEKTFMARLLGLNKSQEDFLSNLGVGDCIVRVTARDKGMPMLIKVPLVEIEMPEDEILNKTHQLTLSLYGKVKSKEHKLLKEIAENPLQSISERIKGSGMSKKAFYEAISALENDGLVKVVYVNTGSGRPKKLLEVTAKGLDLLKAIYPDISLPKFHGGVAHYFWIKELETILKKHHEVEVCQELSNGRIPDLLVDGKIAIEIETSNNVEYAIKKFKTILEEIPYLITAAEEANEKGLFRNLLTAVQLTFDSLERVKVVKVQDLRQWILSHGFLDPNLFFRGEVELKEVLG